MNKKEAKIIADIRNKFGSIYTYFQLEEMILKNEKSERTLKKLKEIQDQGKEICIESMKKIKSLLDSLG